MEQHNATTEAVPCDNYHDCGSHTNPEVAYSEWVRGYEGDTQIVVCEGCF